jgi:alcohol dehydrogenase (cytochrome c)
MHRGKLALVILLAGTCMGVAVAQSPAPVPTLSNGTTIAPHPLRSYTPLTDTALRNPDPSDWVMMRGNYQGWGFSALRQINKANVKGLQLVWARTMESGVNEATPIVYKGVMFLGNPNDVIQAIGAASGDLLWEYRRNLPSAQAFHNNFWGQRKRSVFLYDDKLYTVTRDNFLLALDAKTGKALWEVNRGGDLYITNTTGPIVVNGVVIAGSNCQEAAQGCYVTGNDAATGKELWRNTLIPQKGEPGDETWGGMPFEKRWMTDVWGPITYDPELNLAFYGSSGVGPSSDAQRGVSGVATLAGSNTRFAVDPKTGKIAWKHQVFPQDNADQECTFEMMPITTKVAPDPKAKGMMAVRHGAAAASRRTLTGVPCKTSIMWSFDAAKGDFLWAKSTVFQNLVKEIDTKGKVTPNADMFMTDYTKAYHQCPTHAGGRDWPFSAYSPQTNVMYVQLQNLCADYKVRVDNIPSKPSDQYNTIGRQVLADGSSNIGRLDAISVETGKTLWSWETPGSNYSPVLATAGGVLFNGSMDRYLRAFDQANGKLLWQTRLGSQVFGATVTYRVAGRQYIAVAAGGGFNNGPTQVRPDLDQPSGGNMVYVFALPQ